MSGTTDIYICYPGQGIKEGKCEYSNIQSRMEADSDAARRFANDPKIAKIAYYVLTTTATSKSFVRKKTPTLRSLAGEGCRIPGHAHIRIANALQRQKRACLAV